MTNRASVHRNTSVALAVLCAVACGVAAQRSAGAQDDAWSAKMTQARQAFIARKHDEAKKLFDAAAELVKDTPATDGRYALTLGEWAKVHVVLLEVQPAGELYRKAIAHVGDATPADSVAWAMVLLERIDYMLLAGDRGNKQPTMDRVHALISTAKGVDSPEMAGYHGRMASINAAAQMPAWAFDHIQTAHKLTADAGARMPELRSMVLGYYAAMLGQRGDAGDLQRMLPAHQEAWQLLADKYGKEHEITLNAAIGLAGELLRHKRYTDAKPHAVFAATALQRLAGKQQPPSARLATMAGRACQHTGQLDEAERWHRDALAFYRAAPVGLGLLPASHASVGLLEVLHARGATPQLREVALEAVDLIERYEIPMGRRYRFHEIADNLLRWNQPRLAAEILEKALPKTTVKLPPGFTRRQRVNQGPWVELGKVRFEAASPYAATESGFAELLATCFDKAGDGAKAEHWAGVALAKRDEAIAELGADAAAGHVLAGIIALDRNQPAEALASLRTAWQWRMRDRLALFAGADAQERGDRLRRDNRLAHLLLSACWHARDTVPEAHQIAADVVLTYKSPDVEVVGWEDFASQGDPQAKAQFESLVILRRELASLLLKEKDITAPAKEPQAIAQLRSRIAIAEKSLSQRSATVARMQQEMAVTWKQVSQALPADAVLIDYVRFADQLASPACEKVWIAAILHRRDREPVMTIVGEAKRGGISGYDPVSPEDLLGQFGTRAVKVSSRHPYNDLFRNDGGRHYAPWVLGRLWPEIRTFKRWIICPDAGLGAVPIWLIPQPNSDRLVIDDYEVSTVSTGRAALAFGKAPPRSGAALIIADPNFDATPPAGNSRRPAFIEASVKDLAWNPLPGTRREADAIAALLKAAKINVTVATGDRATKEAVLAARSPRFLHIASHGYFFPQARMYLLGDPFRKYMVLADEKGIVHPNPTEPLNALLYSGVALGGANKGDAGLLTAFEWAGADLSGTELVVLSACDTGRGAEIAGAGVNGLQRSVMQAGARTVVMSLWPVPDEETATLMEMFYKHLLAGQRPAAALRQASLNLRRQLIQTTGRDDPATWGAFVVHGDPGR